MGTSAGRQTVNQICLAIPISVVKCCGVIDSHLVWLVIEASIPTCACFPSENFL